MKDFFPPNLSRYKVLAAGHLRSSLPTGCFERGPTSCRGEGPDHGACSGKGRTGVKKDLARACMVGWAYEHHQPPPSSALPVDSNAGTLVLVKFSTAPRIGRHLHRTKPDGRGGPASVRPDVTCADSGAFLFHSAAFLNLKCLAWGQGGISTCATHSLNRPSHGSSGMPRVLFTGMAGLIPRRKKQPDQTQARSGVCLQRHDCQTRTSTSAWNKTKALSHVQLCHGRSTGLWPFRSSLHRLATNTGGGDTSMTEGF